MQNVFGSSRNFYPKRYLDYAKLKDPKNNEIADGPLPKTEFAQQSPEKFETKETMEEQTTSATASASSVVGDFANKNENYLYDAYWNLYKKDFEESNKDCKPNEIANLSQRSVDNANKKITNKDEAKEHLKDFTERLVEELKAMNMYNDSVKNAMEYVENNFKWDKYFETYPSSNANKLERVYLDALTTLLYTNRIASKFLAYGNL